jgi:hypothetical protein
MCSIISVTTHMKTWMIGTSLGLILALVEFEGRLFNYLENWMGLNCIENNMQKGKKDKGD